MIEELPFIIEEAIMRSVSFKTREHKQRAIDIIMSRHGINPEQEEFTLEELSEKYAVSIERVRQIHMKVLSVLVSSWSLRKYIPFLEELRYQ